MPTARFYDESSYALTLYKGNPDQKMTFTSYPFNWLEASFFYTNIEDKPYCSIENDPICEQDYKDKGFNVKIRLKEEGIFPAIALGINDIAGTGYYGSEYIVASYGLNKTDFHFGLGWGNLNGSKEKFKNPFGILNENFYDRPTSYADLGGQFQTSRYFSGKTASPFLGLNHVLNDKFSLKLEYDTTLTPGRIGFDESKEELSFGFDYMITNNFSIGFSSERGNSSTIRFVYKNNSTKTQPNYEYKKATHKEKDSKYVKFIRNLNNNGIGVNKIIETPEALGVELTQFIHPNLDIIDEIIRKASYDAKLEKEIKKDLRTADLQAISEYDQSFERNSKLIYERKTTKKFKTSNKISLRPFLASREEFFKGAVMLENNSEYIFKENFFFSSNLKYSLLDNFDDLRIPPVNTYPNQVRSDVKDYLRNFDQGVFIGRAQFDYHVTPKKNHHFMVSIGILEEMFNGAGFEYLYFKHDLNYAIGFEVFEVKKRDYKMRLGTLNYQNTVGHLNYYYRNYNRIPFDAKISYGEYLAGDEGITIDISRSFKNGAKFGVFASFTDVSTDDFGEGSFDKGIYFNIPILGNLISYTWSPLTKDPGARLNRKHSLHDLLVKFKPINWAYICILLGHYLSKTIVFK